MGVSGEYQGGVSGVHQGGVDVRGEYRAAV